MEDRTAGQAPSPSSMNGRPRKHGTARDPHVRSRIQRLTHERFFGPVLMQQALPPRESILEQLERIVASDTFAGAERSRALLRFLVEHAVESRSDRLKEYTIGSEALGRGDSFDPRTDPRPASGAASSGTTRPTARRTPSSSPCQEVRTFHNSSAAPFQRQLRSPPHPAARSRRGAGFRGSSGSSWVASPSELR
jgi:hypothetical protein